MTTLEKAIMIALQAHEGQRNKAGAPYIVHPLRVMMKMESEGEMITAVLHDVVEDSEMTMDMLRQEGFPEKILNGLDCLTKRDQESYHEFINLVGQNQLARKVKIADLEDNMNLRRMQNFSEIDSERLKKYRRAWLLLTRGDN